MKRVFQGKAEDIIKEIKEWIQTNNSSYQYIEVIIEVIENEK